MARRERYSSPSSPESSPDTEVSRRERYSSPSSPEWSPDIGVSRRQRYRSPSSPEWSPDTEAAIREQWPDSLSTTISPYLFPPTATPPRPGVPNLRAPKPAPEQKPSSPQDSRQPRYFMRNPPGPPKNPFFPEPGQQTPFSPPIEPRRYSPQAPTLRRVFTSEEDLRPKQRVFRPPPTPPPETEFPARNVVPLKGENFKQKVEPMVKGLVYFYNSRVDQQGGTQYRFLSAADTLHHELFLFGAVDCASETRLCDYYQIYETPTIKLFSNGFDVSTIHRPEVFSVDDLQKFITWAPELSKNRAEEGRDFVEQKALKKQRDHYYKQQSEYYR